MKARLAQLLKRIIVSGKNEEFEGEKVGTRYSIHRISSIENLDKGSNLVEHGSSKLFPRPKVHTKGLIQSTLEGQVEIVINGKGCCEKLPESFLDDVKKERIWLVPKRGQLERLIEKSIIEDGLWTMELSSDVWLARIIVKDGIIIGAKMEMGSAVYRGKAAVTMIDSLSGPANLRIARLRGPLMDKDPLVNYFFGKRFKGVFKEIAQLRGDVIKLLNLSYKAIIETNMEKLCEELSKLQVAFEKLSKVEEKVLERGSNDRVPLSGHRFEHALILKGLSSLRDMACIEGSDLESILVKFFKLVDEIKVHFSQRDVEVYRTI